jgi:hypothetical protein
MDAAKVVDIRGGSEISLPGEPVAEIVQWCEQMLERARSGELRAVAVLELLSAGKYHTEFLGPDELITQAIGLATLLQVDMTCRALRRAGDAPAGRYDVSGSAADASVSDAIHDDALRQIDDLRRQLAEAREQFTMHTAEVHAWLSAVLTELDIAGEGDTVDVATACTLIMGRCRHLRDLGDLR